MLSGHFVMSHRQAELFVMFRLLLLLSIVLHWITKSHRVRLTWLLENGCVFFSKSRTKTVRAKLFHCTFFFIKKRPNASTRQSLFLLLSNKRVRPRIHIGVWGCNNDWQIVALRTINTSELFERWAMTEAVVTTSVDCRVCLSSIEAICW